MVLPDLRIFHASNQVSSQPTLKTQAVIASPSPPCNDAESITCQGEFGTVLVSKAKDQASVEEGHQCVRQVNSANVRSIQEVFPSIARRSIDLARRIA